MGYVYFRKESLGSIKKGALRGLRRLFMFVVLVVSTLYTILSAGVDFCLPANRHLQHIFADRKYIHVWERTCRHGSIVD